MLNVVFGVPYNVAVGSDLGQMCGMSTAATVRHMRVRQHRFPSGCPDDYGDRLGSRGGGQPPRSAEHAGTWNLGGHDVDVMTVVMSLVYATLLILLGQAMVRESLRTMKRQAGALEGARERLLLLAMSCGR